MYSFDNNFKNNYFCLNTESHSELNESLFKNELSLWSNQAAASSLSSSYLLLKPS